MNVKTLCLAILCDCEATGYEIRKLSTEGEYAYFVEASYGSIYPALAKLEEDGLVASRVEAQQGRPSKKIYAITEKGRKAFLNSLFEPLNDDVFRSEFLLFARFASELPRSLVEQRLNEYLRHLEEKLAYIEEASEKLEKPEDCWVAKFGRHCVGLAHEYVATHMHELIAQAQPDADVAEAAE